MIDYKTAVELATRCHRHQYRKNSGEDYITHSLAVAKKFDDDTHKIVAVLHDTIEDTDLTFYELARDYRPDDGIMDALKAITKVDGQTYIDFIIQVKKNEIATAVKVEDLLHNLSDLENGNLREKYLMALWILAAQVCE